ncbi:MAG: cob(I)yrinic acid a,c-diamide adenosyltransferase [Candidatus Schekmanbacteria bacterium]|nr:MAG: cob(I)yrinic acid a,c-diamide adenosyltransferase [Candidatus Schekmanbacteria bacterium]
MKKFKEGFIQVYTGSGKGKTTAALGLALRAAGHGFKSMIIQFMKGDKNYGEIIAHHHLSPYITIRQFGLCTFVDKNNPSAEDLKLASEGIGFARKISKGNEFDILVLDEINCAVDFGLVKEEELLDIMENKNPHMELILTGRYASRKIIEKADLVTEMKEIKHYYRNKKITSREGIEW